MFKLVSKSPLDMRRQDNAMRFTSSLEVMHLVLNPVSRQGCYFARQVSQLELYLMIIAT